MDKFDQIWAPKEDITAYELALCQPVFAIIRDSKRRKPVMEKIKGLPEEAQRHFDTKAPGHSTAMRMREMQEEG